MGLCFGFARFIKVQDAFKLEKILGELQIDNRRLVVNVSMYKRKSSFQVEMGQYHAENRGGIRMVGVPGNPSFSTGGFKSYSEAVSGKFHVLGSKSLDPLSSTSSKVAIISCSFHRLEGCLVGEAKDLELLENFFQHFLCF